MLTSFKKGLLSYAFLFNFKDYKTYEIIIKIVLLPVVLIIYSALFILTTVFYLIERVFSLFFRAFLLIQGRLMTKRFHISPLTERLLSLGIFLLSILFLPFIFVYYLAMFIKYILKYFMRLLIIKMDFSVQFSYQDIVLFDDKRYEERTVFTSAFSDMAQTDALGQVLETFFHDMQRKQEALEDETFVEDVSNSEKK
jgi:hypothetical protein